MSPRQRKSSGKSSATGRPFVPGDPRIQRGRGPKKGAPNAGAPPSALREAYRMAATERLPFLLDCVDGKLEGASVGDRIKAFDLLNKYGGMTSVEVTAPPKLVQVDL